MKFPTCGSISGFSRENGKNGNRSDTNWFSSSGRCSNTVFFLVRIFPHLGWIQREYLSVFSPNAGKYAPKIYLEITSIVWKAESKHSETLKLKHKERTFLRNFLLWLSNYIIEEGHLFMLQFQSFWVFRLWISNGIGNFPRSWGTKGSAGPEVPGVHEILRYWASLGPRSPGGPGGSGGPGVPGLGPTFLPCQVAFCKK